MNVTDEVLMIMRWLMVGGTGKGCAFDSATRHMLPWIAIGHPDLLPGPGHFITPTDGCRDFIIKISFCCISSILLFFFKSS